MSADRRVVRRSCTALTGPGSRCGNPLVVRDFVPALHPGGFPIRLCAVHDRRFYNAAISGARGNVALFEKLCDEWRWAWDCGPLE